MLGFKLYGLNCVPAIALFGVDVGCDWCWCDYWLACDLRVFGWLCLLLVVGFAMLVGGCLMVGNLFDVFVFPLCIVCFIVWMCDLVAACWLLFIV